LVAARVEGIQELTQVAVDLVAAVVEVDQMTADQLTVLQERQGKVMQEETLLYLVMDVIQGEVVEELVL
jgi:hypothetical protein